MTFACEKRKQRSAVYEFHSFGEPGYPICPVGPFRDNIRLFLQQCSEPESNEVQSMPMWCTLLVDEKRNLVVPFYTIEENVSISDNPFCLHCQCTDNVNNKPKVHCKVLELLSGASFAIGSGARYTHRELEKWDKVSIQDGIRRVRRALIAAAFECPYTGGYIDVYCCNASENIFKQVHHIKVLEAYKLEYADLHDDHDKSVFLLYSNNLKETNIRSIPEVSQYGHDVAKTLSGLFVRRVTFRDVKTRDEFFADSYWCKRLPDIFYDTRTRELKENYRHFELMCYKRINNEIAFFSKPSLEFLQSFETDLVTSTSFFPVHLLNW